MFATVLRPEFAQVLELVADVLRLLEKHQVMLSGENYATSSLVVPMFRGLLTELDALRGQEKYAPIDNILNELRRNIERRQGSYLTCHLLATVLDPRYKGQHLTDAELAEATKLLEEMARSRRSP